MKLGKLSLVAVMALGTSAFAIDNVKVSGEAKLIYQTADWETTTAGAREGFFKTGGTSIAGASYGGGSSGGASLVVGATADLAAGISGGAEVQAFTTLGLENNLVDSTMIGDAGTAGTGIGIEDSYAMSQLWLAATLGNTTVKVGRMELDTPLAFTEKWNILKNTFDAAVVINKDLPQTTLVAAWVGRDNGMNGSLVNYGGNGRTAALYSEDAGNGSSAFSTFGNSQGAEGAYAFAAINTSIPDTTVQAWYFDLVDAADAFWLQADGKVAGMVNLGAQYAAINLKGQAAVAGREDSKIWAVKAAGDVSGVNVYAAYSKADDTAVGNAALGFSNVSTADKTKIYTGDGSIYMDGIVTAPGTTAYKIGASTKMVPGVALATSYCDAQDVAGANNDINAWDISASGKVAMVNMTAIYTSVNNDSTMYGGRDNDTLRIIASLKF